MIKEIAKYIVDAGISNTESGNWHITFDEVNTGGKEIQNGNKQICYPHF